VTLLRLRDRHGRTPFGATILSERLVPRTQAGQSQGRQAAFLASALG
jgi:hypothetical protein